MRNRQALRAIGPWIAFLAVTLWVFPLRGIARGVPTYGDPLEILWSVERHCAALAKGEWFLNAPEVLYPFGLDMKLYPQWMAVNLLSTPFCLLPDRAAALNILTLIAVAAIFAGALSAARRSFGLSWPFATLGGLSITFYALQFYQVVDHLNILLGLVAWTWMWVQLLKAVDSLHPDKRQGLVVGLLWGTSVLFSVYFFWIGLLLLALLMGRHLKKKFALFVGIGAALIGLPWGLIFYRTLAGAESPFPIHHLYIYAASPDLWPLPSVYHRWWGQWVWAYLRNSGYEGNLAMLGPIPFVLGLLGLVRARKERSPLAKFLWPTTIGLVLSLGIYLKWRTQLVRIPGVESVNALLWKVGHILKPALFPTTDPPADLQSVIPLPGFLWVLLIPFTESSRAMVRYLFLAAPWIFLAAADWLSHISRKGLRLVLGLLWALDFIFIPVHWKSLDTLPPALEWLSQQPARGAVFSLDRDGVAWSGKELWASLFHRHPLIHASAYWFPPHIRSICDHLLSGPARFETAIQQLRMLGLEYLFIHRNGALADTFFRQAVQSSRLSLVQCFPPPEQESPWPGEICVFRYNEGESALPNVSLVQGWSLPEEDWGIWAMGEEARVGFGAMGDRKVWLELNAFPLCVPQKQQEMEIWVNETFWTRVSFNGCEMLSFRQMLPFQWVRQGYNELMFRFAYAYSPAEIEGASNPDPRRLSVGFTRLQVSWEP